MSKKPKEPEETKYQKELAKIAVEQWNDYQDTFVPVENEYMSRANKMGEENQYSKVAGDVNTSFNSSYDEAGQEVDHGLAAAGVNPSSGKASSSQTNLIEDKLGKESQATSAGQHNATQRYTGNLQNIVAIGKGQEAKATAGLQDIAAASGRKASNDALAEARKVSLPAAALGIAGSAAANNPGMFKSNPNPNAGMGQAAKDINLGTYGNGRDFMVTDADRRSFNQGGYSTGLSDWSK